MAAASSAPSRSWAETLSLYSKPIMLSMLILGFASGFLS